MTLCAYIQYNGFTFNSHVWMHRTTKLVVSIVLHVWTLHDDIIHDRRVDIVISDAALGHILVDIAVVDPSRRDLVERAARQDLVAATDAERWRETHYRDRAPRTKFVPLALETYDALFDRSDRFLVVCATLTSTECVGSGPSISLLCTWFHQRVSIMWSILQHNCILMMCSLGRPKLS